MYREHAIAPRKATPRKSWTPRRAARATICVALVCLVSAALAWLAGFDFDTRNTYVSAYTFFTVLAAAFLAWFNVAE